MQWKFYPDFENNAVEEQPACRGENGSIKNKMSIMTASCYEISQEDVMLTQIMKTK